MALPSKGKAKTRARSSAGPGAVTKGRSGTRLTSLSQSRPPVLLLKHQRQQQRRGPTERRTVNPPSNPGDKSDAISAPCGQTTTQLLTSSTKHKHTRTLIRTHHTLNKAYTRAAASGDLQRAEDLRAQLKDLGGLQAYQRASALGQSKLRGGDSSRVLVEWLKELLRAAERGRQGEREQRRWDQIEEGPEGDESRRWSGTGLGEHAERLDEGTWTEVGVRALRSENQKMQDEDEDDNVVAEAEFDQTQTNKPLPSGTSSSRKRKHPSGCSSPHSQQCKAERVLRIRVLEIGSLSADNAISQFKYRFKPESEFSSSQLDRLLPFAPPYSSPSCRPNQSDIETKAGRKRERGVETPTEITVETDMTRIDLHSTDPKTIQEIDFMQMPVPSRAPQGSGKDEGGDGDEDDDGDDGVDDDHDGKFDVISLSLVLNYVPTPEGRGDMLRRVPLFLRRHRQRSRSVGEGGGGRRPRPLLQDRNEKLREVEDSAGASRPVPPPTRSHGESTPPASRSPSPFPSIFLVLPLPCVTNSRYLTEARLADILGSLGLRAMRVKKSARLYYSLWGWSPDASPEGVGGAEEEEEGGGTGSCGVGSDPENVNEKEKEMDVDVQHRPNRSGREIVMTRFKKREIHPGPRRNNFAVVLT